MKDEVDVHDPKYRREQRVQRLMNSKGFTRVEAEEVVDEVIKTKEQPRKK